MLPYFLVYFLLVLSCLFGKANKNERVLIIPITILIIFAGFRYNVGVDYGEYVEQFSKEVGTENREIGFNFLIDVIIAIGAKPQMLFLICAIVMQIFVYNFFRTYNFNVWLSLMIYYCVSTFYIATFNGVRQYMAIGAFMLCLPLIRDRSFIRFCVVMLVSVLFFHESILIFFPLYFILNKDWSLTFKVCILVAVILINKSIDLVLAYTPYLTYATRDRETELSVFTYVFLAGSFLLILLENRISFFKDKRIFFNINYLNFLLLLLTVIQSEGILKQMYLRLDSYVLFAYIVMIPALLNQIRSKELKAISYLAFNVGVFLYLVRTIAFHGGEYMLVPYKMNFNLF